MRLLNRTEAAHFLGISRRTLEKWAVTGDGPPFYKLGGRVLYDQSDLEDWIASKRRLSTSDPGQEAASNA